MFRIFLFCLMAMLARATLAEGLRVVAVNAGILMKFENGVPQGPAIDYVIRLFTETGYNIVEWVEVPMARGQKVILQGNFDVMFPFNPELGTRDIEYVELAKLSMAVFSNGPITQKNSLILTVRVGMDKLSEDSAALKGLKVDYIPLSGTNVINRMKELLKSGRVDGIIAVKLHTDEFKKDFKNLVITDLKRDVSIGVGIHSKKIDLEKIRKKVEQLGSISDYIENDKKK